MSRIRIVMDDPRGLELRALMSENERLREAINVALDLVGSESGKPLIGNIQARGVLTDALADTGGETK